MIRKLESMRAALMLLPLLLTHYSMGMSSFPFPPTFQLKFRGELPTSTSSYLQFPAQNSHKRNCIQTTLHL